MATNVEIKARVKNPDQLRVRAEALSGAPGQKLFQEDTFFCIPRGRLKLRVLAPDNGQLIYYEREDVPGPKQSHYLVYPTSDPATLSAVLTEALGVRGSVRKERWLFWVGNTRIHLDQVEGLGSFMELEVVMGAGQSVEQGMAIALELMQELGVSANDLVEGAYIDLSQQP